jgi:multicomponent Na+:H+ antiporter subunit E
MTKYVELFAWELLTANIDVAKRVLSPSLPIAPEVVEYELDIETELAITTLANSITLTPGTLTLDHDEEEQKLIIHAIDGAEHPEEVKEPIKRWENLLKKIEGDRE